MARRTASRGRVRRLWPLAAVGLVLVVVAAVGALAAYRRLSPDGPLATNRQEAAPALVASTGTGRGDIGFAEESAVATGPNVEVEIDVPDGATEMQVGFDPTFASVEWIPVAPRLIVATDDVGHQMLFGRFRSGPDGEPTERSVAAITIDPTFGAATASADGLHQPTWVRPLGPDLVVVRIEGGRIEPGRQIDYDFDDPPGGDDVSGLFGPRFVDRDGQPFGRQVTGRDDLLRTFDRLLGEPVDVAALRAGPWTITDTDGGSDPSTAAVVEVVTRPQGNGLGPGAERITPLAHEVILRLPAALVEGGRYRVDPPAGVAEPIELILDASTTVSPAVNVNQNGFEPSDPLKVAYVSGYPIEAARPAVAAGTGFRVVSAEAGDVVVEGLLSARPGGDELGQGDLTGTPVYEADFSTVEEPGRYRVCVDEVGCSEDFAIDDRAWERLAVAVARSMYHQRSGIALGPPYTAVARPRPYHPDDGLVVTESEHRLLDTFGRPDEERFVDLVAERTEIEVPTAWGGHFDAGDWDRRAEHLYYVRVVAELVEADPERYEALDVGIPESGDAVPDLLDEGLWTLDLFRRLQRADGAVSGGVEASEHPQQDNTSWTDSLAVFTYEPDPWTTYLYAGVAAQTADVLGRYDPERAADYLASAEAAMAWAEAQPVEEANAELIQAHRSVAAVALYKATGEQRWHELFRETTTLGDDVDRFLSCHEHTRCDAAWLYLTIEPEETDPALRALIEDSVVATADEILAAAETTAFGWTLENRGVPLIWGLGVGGAPKTIGLLRAHALTGEERYLAGAQRSASVSLGANPTNTVFVTGIGRTPIRHPLIVDVLNGGLAPWSGTPVYGTHRLNTEPGEEWVEDFILGPAGVDPLPSGLPYLWQWVDVPDVPMFNEFTVFQSHGAALHAFGLLAAADDS